MLNNQPVGDLWYLQDNDSESQHYLEPTVVDFSCFHSDKMKKVYKDYIWTNWKTGNKRLKTIAKEFSYIKHFVYFAKLHNISSFSELDNAKVELYLSFIRTRISNKTKKPLTYKVQKGCLDSVKAVVSWCQIHSPDNVPTSEIFTGNEFVGTNQHVRIDFIPDDVMTQINIALKSEENIYLKNAIVILESTGMRVGDLLKLHTDCISSHVISGCSISWYDHKNHKMRAPMPVRQECANAVRQLLEFTAPLRRGMDTDLQNLLFIYKPVSGRNAGQVVAVPQNTLHNWIKGFVRSHHINDGNGEPYNLTSHHFRRTLGTDMLSKGTDLNVIQRVLGHADPSITKRYYADVKDKDRAEIFKNIGIIGNIDLIDDSSFENSAEKDWFQANKDKGAALCDGYCTKPYVNGEVCDRLLRRHKCYSCSRYITTPEYLQVHRDHLARLEKQLEEGAIYGEHYAEHFRPTIDALKLIINKLEDLQNG